MHALNIFQLYQPVSFQPLYCVNIKNEYYIIIWRVCSCDGPRLCNELFLLLLSCVVSVCADFVSARVAFCVCFGELGKYSTYRVYLYCVPVYVYCALSVCF